MRRSVVLALLLVPIAASAVPVELAHQGRLFDASGAPLSGAHDVSFQLYDAPSGGALQWSEDQSAVLFEQGYYSVDLGQLSPFDLDLLADASELWMGISVDAGPPLAQRLPLQSVPYAIVAARAHVATSLSGGPVDATALTINGTPVVASDGSIDWSRISGAPTQLGDLSCTSAGMIPQWSGTSWGCVAENAHNHSADQITSGTLDMNVLPVGSGENTIARGNHTHSPLDVDLGPLDPANPLNHDRYTDAEARVAVGPHYTDGDAIAAVGPHYTNNQALAAMGGTSDTNPLNHDRYTDAEARVAVGPHYTNNEAVSAMGGTSNTNPLNHDRYTDAEAEAAAFRSVGRKLLVVDYLRANSDIYPGGTAWQYASLDGKAGPFTITTNGGPVRIYFKAMTYVYENGTVRTSDDAGVIIHPVIDGVREEYCDLVYARGWGTNEDAHGPIVCDFVRTGLAPGVHTISFEHRYLGYRSILYGGRYKSIIMIEQL